MCPVSFLYSRCCCVPSTQAPLRETIFLLHGEIPVIAILSVHGLGKWFAKFRTVNFVPDYHLYKSVSFTGKRPRRPETGIKYGFEEMDPEFPIGIFHAEKQDYLFRCSVAPGNFPLGRPKKSCSIYFRTGFPGKFL